MTKYVFKLTQLERLSNNEGIEMFKQDLSISLNMYEISKVMTDRKQTSSGEKVSEFRSKILEMMNKAEKQNKK